MDRISVYEHQKAVFAIKKHDFDRITKELALEQGPFAQKEMFGDVEGVLDESAVEAIEKSYAKSQGFLLTASSARPWKNLL